MAAKKKLTNFFIFSHNYDIPEFEATSKTFINWSYEILNFFDYPYTNGFTKAVRTRLKLLSALLMGCVIFAFSDPVFYTRWQIRVSTNNDLWVLVCIKENL